jgi:hypothetical protein
MHYSVMTEKHLADRWQVSRKMLRQWLRISAVVTERFGSS